LKSEKGSSQKPSGLNWLKKLHPQNQNLGIISVPEDAKLETRYSTINAKRMN